MRLRRIVASLASVALLPFVALPADAQVRPDLQWQTLQRGPIRVHFTPELEDLARRTLLNAEWAYARLASELPAPRGMVDLVVADNVDYANGFATPFPSNRIVVYARPPVDEMALRNHEDWNRILVLHEMVHVFHLDRAESWWGWGQRVFGRAAPLFPNIYAPNWLLEGVAVHYESRLMAGGRLNGTEFPAHLRALAFGGELPALDAVVSPRPFYPGGNTPYLVGSYLVDGLMQANASLGEAESMARLIDRMSRRLLPWRHDASAREATGRSFTDVYHAWRDSLRSAHPQGSATAQELPRALTSHEFTAAYPRFDPLADGVIHYVADDGRQNPGRYVLSLQDVDQVRRRREGRRNTVDTHVPVGGAIGVHAEWDRTDPYSVRSDLYVSRGARRSRRTVDGRISHPDAHAASGTIVAVRTRPGTTELVLMSSATDASPRVLAAGSLTRTWSEPRLSRSGALVAAAQWEYGGRTAVVVLDTAGVERQRFAPRVLDGSDRLAVLSAPAWLPGDSLLLFVSDHEGRPMVYRGDVRSGAYQRLWETQTALRSPDASPDGREMVATELRARGWAVVVRPMPELAPLPAAPPADERGSAAADAAVPSLAAAESLAVRPYRAFRHSLPRWWLPAVATADDNAALVGLMSSGRDLVGRHAWTASLLQDLTRPEQQVTAAYSYAGLGNPVLSLGWEREWSHFLLTDQVDQPLGDLALASDLVSATLLFSRPRVRLTSFALIGAEVERVSFRVDPDSAADNFPDGTFAPENFPRLVGSVGFSTMQRPGLSVSVEDGVAVQLTLRHRFREGAGSGGDERVAVQDAILRGSAAKSLPLPGFARHVVAVRAAVGVADPESFEPFDVGGVSGASLEVLPGLTYGDPTRTFFVRGFPAGLQRGDRAAAGSAEYRVPLARVGRGYRLLPTVLQNVSALAFADAGAAWCDGPATGAGQCGYLGSKLWLGSVGAELVLDASLEYDVLYRFRLGLVRTTGGPLERRGATSLYFTLGNTF